MGFVSMPIKRTERVSNGIAVGCVSMCVGKVKRLKTISRVTSSCAISHLL